MSAESPRVHRAAATALWEHDHRWGSRLGDTTTLYVRRTDGGSLGISYGNESVEIREELVAHLAGMVAAAAAWTDAPTDTTPEKETP